jgi:hypothetical protein
MLGPQPAHIIADHGIEPCQPTRSAITVAGTSGYSVKIARTRASNGVNAVGTDLRSYFGGRSEATARSPVARPIPNCLATCRRGTPSATSRLINAQSSTEITHPSVWVALFSTVGTASFSTVADTAGQVAQSTCHLAVNSVYRPCDCSRLDPRARWGAMTIPIPTDSFGNSFHGVPCHYNGAGSAFHLIDRYGMDCEAGSIVLSGDCVTQYDKSLYFGSAGDIVRILPGTSVWQGLQRIDALTAGVGEVGFDAFRSYARWSLVTWEARSPLAGSARRGCDGHGADGSAVYRHRRRRGGNAGCRAVRASGPRSCHQHREWSGSAVGPGSRHDRELHSAR